MDVRLGAYTIRKLDEHNYELIEHYVTKDAVVAGKEIKGGEEKEKRLGYYGKLENALNSLLNKHLKDKDEITTVELLLSEIKKLQNFFAEAVKQQLAHQEKAVEQQ